MPIDTRHPEHIDRQKQWVRCRDALGGEDTVKGKNETYLPRLGSQTGEDYATYKTRGFFLEAMARTIQGLSGAVFRKDPVISHRDSEEIEAWLDNVDGMGQPLVRLAQRAMDENLSIGRVALRLTMSAEPGTENLPRLLVVPGEAIINWDPLERWIIIEEEARDTADDPYEHKTVKQWREYRLDERGLLEVRLWREKNDIAPGQDKFMLVDTFIPMRRGERLDFIPIWTIAGDEITLSCRKPDLLGLADASFDHYRLVTDYRHGLHWTALPTPVFAGFPTDEQIKVGSGTAIVSQNAGAKAEMLEFKGQGLGALEKAIDRAENLLASLGARLIEQPKRAAEAAETIKLRAMAEQTTVQSMARTVGKALSMAVRQALWWGGIEDEDFTIELNTDLVDAEVNVELIRELHAQLIAGSISYETYYYALQKGNVTRPEVDAEAERAQIEQIEDNTFADAAG